MGLWWMTNGWTSMTAPETASCAATRSSGTALLTMAYPVANRVMILQRYDS